MLISSPLLTDVELSPAQTRICQDIAQGGHHIVLGSAGAGKTLTAVSLFTQWVSENGPDQAVFLTPTRQRAAALRPLISRAFGGTTGNVLVRTPASLAFGILRAAAAQRAEPSPTLISGPEQDHILAELIAGHLAGDGQDPGWPEDFSPTMLAMRAFRDELRDLLMRAAEAGLDGQALQDLGHRESRPEWVAAGRLLDEYTFVTLLGEATPDRGARFDAATILDQAINEIAADPALAGFGFVVHDDYQDATLATSRLLDSLRNHGARLALFANPDTAVQSFRGGVPALTHTATLPAGTQDGAFGATAHVLPHVYHRPGVWQALQDLSQDLPPLVGASRRRAEAQPDLPTDVAAEPEVVCHVLPSTSAQASFIARKLRERHVFASVPWSDMAVIVRGHHQLVTLRRALTSAGVPIKVAGAEVPLRDEPVVRALITALDVATTPGGPTFAQATDLLTSVFGGIDSVGLRRIRRALRQGEPAKPSADLVIDALMDSGLRAGLPKGFGAVAAMIGAGQQAAGAEFDVETVLWRIWDAAAVAKPWQERALSVGPGADRADADLDAVVALFTAAEQFSDRRTGASPRAFIEHIAGQDFAADTLAARSERRGAVTLHTPASAVGEHWRFVVVAGVQEDTWPDLRLRDTMLGSAALADLATRRHRTGAHPHSRARQEILHDELRIFLAACSRASESLTVTAVLDTDTRPSVFFERLVGDLPGVTQVVAPLDLRGLVGTLRRQVNTTHRNASESEEPVDPGRDSDRRAAAWALLLTLADAGVAGADPSRWSGQWSTEEPLISESERVAVSPSAMEMAMTCPLRWFLTNHGGSPTTTRAQDLGILIHEIASEHPNGSHSELLAVLDERWEQLDMPDTHAGRAQRARAEKMIANLAHYLASHGAPTEVEVEFTADVGRATLRGRVDRVEHRSGGPHIVDLKTGKNPIKVEQAKRAPQLAAYQVAVSEGVLGSTLGDQPREEVDGHQSGGASLVYLGDDRPVVREQAPLQQDPEPTWAHDVVEQAAQVMSGSTFLALPSKDVCRHCPVKSSCPTKTEGKRLGDVQ